MAFQTTRWSLVARAGRSGEESRVALEELCSAYWKPVYVHVRGRGYSDEDARDLTQEFFLFLIDKRIIARADTNRGRFRSFLSATLRNFLTNEWDRKTARKRSGRYRAIRLDGLERASEMVILADRTLTPDEQFDRAWAMSILEHGLHKLRDEWVRNGQADLFDALESRLTGDTRAELYRDIAERFGKTDTAIKLMVHRMRKRFGELIREEVEQTVSNGDDLDNELKYFKTILG